MYRIRSMTLPIATLAATTLAFAGCGGDAALAPDTAGSDRARAEAALLAPGGTVVYHAEMRVEPPAGPFALVHAMIEFQPGTWFPAHVHGGPGLYTLVEGSVTVTDGGSETDYHAGESYTQEPGQVLAAGNLGASPSTMAVAFVLPEGEELITFHPDDNAALPFPDIFHSLATGPLTRAAPFSVVQLVVDLEPGAWTTAGSHPGPALFTVLTGEVVLRRPAAEQEVVPAGVGWVLRSEEPATVQASDPAGARLVGTYIVPRGEVLARGG